LEERIKISAVSYSNSVPFIYGLRNHPIFDHIDLTLDNPADCASKLLTGQVDLGLVPVAVIPELNNARIVSNFCIGANGPVETVCLFSEVPLSEVRSILLDYQSRTSVQLVRYLASNAWKISPEWKQADIHFIDQIQGDTAGVVIGDRAFGLEKKFPTVIDLSQEWKKHTALPFVFACWVSNRNLPESFLSMFNQALQFGLDNRKTAVKELPTHSEHDLERYVQEVISYDLDEKKLRAMKLFLDWMSKSG
jgi:chorismate dehydratase